MKLRQHVGAEPAELVRCRSRLRSTRGSPARSARRGRRTARSTRAARPRPSAPGLERAERLGERLHLVGDLGRERAEQVFLVGEVQVEGAVRRLGELHDVVDAGRVVALRSRTPRRRRRGAGASCAGRGPAAPGVRAPGRAARARPGVGSRRARGLPAVPFARGTAVRVRGPDAGVTFRPLGLTGAGLRRYALTPMSGRVELNERATRERDRRDVRERAGRRRAHRGVPGARPARCS